MTTYVPVALREMVTRRARGYCEYCRASQALSYVSFEIEHIIAEKHGGATAERNLALACQICNRHKGTDLGSLDPASGLLTSFFHPRNHRWEEHFRLEGGHIIALTAEGRVTVQILRFNDPYRVAERIRAIAAGIFPL